MNVLYIMWAEDVLYDPIIKSQVINQLSRLRDHDPGIQCTLLLGLPYARYWIQKYLMKKSIDFKKNLENLKRDINSAQIGVCIRKVHLAFRPKPPLLLLPFYPHRRTLLQDRILIGGYRGLF